MSDRSLDFLDGFDEMDEPQPSGREWTPTDPNAPATGHGNKEQGGDPGVTKREYFAAQALKGFLADHCLRYDAAAEYAVKTADALIDALNERGGSDD